MAIPVIFRPWHEHTGSWFWWGQKLCNTDEFIALWRFTFDYLCNEKNIHNLLFAYSSGGDIENTEQYLERYPGNDYVDLMGFDYYQMPDAGNSSFTENVSRVLEIVTEAASGQGKLAALTEAGYEGIPDSAWWTQLSGRPSKITVYPMPLSGATLITGRDTSTHLILTMSVRRIL